MDPYRPDDPLSAYLKLRSLLYDRITGLPAYRTIIDDVRAMLEGRRRVGVIHVEISNLELIESLYGWQVFDRIVGRAARALGECIGRVLPATTLPAVNGVGGDRLLAFVPHGPDGRDVDAPTMARYGAALLGCLDSAFDDDDFGGLNPRLYCREGYALVSEDPFYRFERRVHAAVEEARMMSGRREARRELSWGAELRRIIKHEEVRPVYQPIVDLATLEVLGYEAFVRGPKDSLLEMPVALFALSQAEGVAAELDRLCRRASLSNLGDLLGRGRVFLNVLPEDLHEADWRDGPMAALLESARLLPTDVVLEIPERRADMEIDRLEDTCAHLRAEGFGLALDDVGTGYSSIATIERVRPHFVKIDASVVHELHRNLIQQDVLVSLVELSRRLGSDVIAEGVESEQEVIALRRAGARFAQGFLYAGPSPASAASRSLRTAGHGR